MQQKHHEKVIRYEKEFSFNRFSRLSVIVMLAVLSGTGCINQKVRYNLKGITPSGNVDLKQQTLIGTIVYDVCNGFLKQGEKNAQFRNELSA